MTSLNHSNNLCLVTFHCPTKSASGSGDSYWQSQETEIQKAKEELKNAKESDKSKKEKDLKKLQSGLDEHIAKDHPLDESTRSNKIKEVNEQKDFVKKFGDDFNNALNDGSNNILTHLCDGLEKFLGYDKTSKGYNGTGIVYSDLDRLCNGVMAFLSGVLNEVKNDPSVTTYYKGMEKTLQTIKNNMHKSRGLSAAVEAVSRALGAWDGELTSKLRDVENKFNNLIHDNFISIETSLNALNKLSGESLSLVPDALQKCFDEALRLQQSFRRAKSACFHFDVRLRSAIENNTTRVELAIEQFVASATNAELKNITGFAKWQLEVLQDNIRKHVSNLIGDMQKVLQDKFRLEIQEPMKVVKQRLSTAKSNLEEWIQRSTQGIKGAMEVVKKIVDKLEGRDATKENGETNDEMKAVQDAAGDISGKAETLLDAINKAEGIIGDTIREANETVVQLDTALRQDLHTVKEKIKITLHAFVNQLGTALAAGITGAEIYDYVRGGRNGVKAFVAALTGDLTEIGRHLKALPEDANNGIARGLEILFNGLHEYRKNTPSSVTSSIPPYNELLNLLSKNIEGVIQKALDTDIGADASTSGPPKEVDIKTASLNFIGYKRYITRENLAINNLKGALPTAIESIKTRVGQKINGIEHPRGLKITFGKLKEANQHFNTKFDVFLKAIKKLVRRDTYDFGNDHLEYHLRTLLSMMSKDGKQVYGISEGLESIKDDMECILGPSNHKQNLSTLATLIEKAEDFDASIATKAPEVIMEINKFATCEVKERIEGIQETAKYEYHLKMREMLNRMTNTVTNNIAIINRIIKNDLRNGMKGLLRTMLTHISTLERVVIKTTVNDLSPKLNEYSNEIWQYIKWQIDSLPTPANSETEDVRNAAVSTSSNPISEKFSDMRAKFCNLLGHLQKDAKKYNYDNKFVDLREDFKSSLTALHPSAFANPRHPELLDAVKKGLQGFVEQMGRVYVNRYDGGEGIDFKANELVTTGGKEEKLTDKGRNLSKVFLTILEMMNGDLKYLKNRSISKWSTSRIYAGSSLGTFLQNCGYVVPKNETSQDGELRYEKECDGKYIYDLLVGNFPRIYSPDKDAKYAFGNLCDCLTMYYDVCHIATSSSTRRPCSVFEMLVWCTSLLHHPVYTELTTNEFKELFDKPNNQDIHGKKDSTHEDAELIDLSSLSLTAYPQNITHEDLSKAIIHVTSLAPMLLTTVAGYGDEQTTYAVDYYSNAFKLVIPSSPVECFNMLLELQRRLFPVFRFLHSRCSNAAADYGWSQCQYGRDVESCSWQCKDHSKSDVDCRPRSPLMSYLRDSLPGHLPHQVTKVDCKSECQTCPKSTPGMPCLTPLGFKGFSGSKRTGKDISNVLTKFFDKGVASCLLSMSPRPPSSLPEHYAFALSFVRGWSFSSSNGLKTKIESTMQKASIDLYSDASPLTNAQRNAYGEARSSHGTNHPKTSEAAISSLSISTRCNGANHCGPYLSTLYSDTYPYFGNKHCNAYMSWSVYLPWTFWQQLNSLYNAFLQIFCQDWGCTCCLRGDTCKKGTHGMLNPDVPGDGCTCPSIVGCKGVGPTLYQYGFTFQDVHCLISNQTKCFNLRNQLFSVLNSQYFKDLFKECDEFLWIIRQPFSYLVLALWSLSLFYLICVMVGRLDVLHIKPHLRIPSSHRITAQSLLAAAQVGRLAKISYLQP